MIDSLGPDGRLGQYPTFVFAIGEAELTDMVRQNKSTVVFLGFPGTAPGLVQLWFPTEGGVFVEAHRSLLRAGLDSVKTCGEQFTTECFNGWLQVGLRAGGFDRLSFRVRTVDLTQFLDAVDTEDPPVAACPAS
jgi:hypothetical protein